jgi:hypothetical protein
MIKAHARRAKKWDGEPKRKNFWISGGIGTGKSAWATEQTSPGDTAAAYVTT